MTLPVFEATLNGPDAAWQRLLALDPEAPVFDVPGTGAAEGGGSGTVWRRRDFEAQVDARCRAGAEAGIRPGDIVAWLGLNAPAQAAALLACDRLGACFLPLNWRLAAAELAAVLRHAGVASIQGSDDFPALRAALDTAWQAAGGPAHGAAQPDDRLLVYTSGTTGEPKGAMHTGAQLLANARAAITVQGLSRATRCLAVLPMFHVGGLCIQLLPTLLAGGLVRLHPRFDPAAWLRDVAAWKPDTSLMVPATMRAVIDHPAWAATDLSSLRFLNSGSSVVPLALIEAFHGRGVPVTQVYGSTETGPFSIAQTPAEGYTTAGSVGTPAPGVQVRLVDGEGAEVPAGDVGEIRVRGDNVMRGYHRAPQHPAFVDGWFHSGDLARLRPDGRYEVVGRSKDMIISGGENIYPAEIENLVLGVSGVAECAVVGVPDARWGEVPVLAVVPTPGSTPDLDAVRASYQSRIARFKHPRQVLVLDELPKTALGKVRKADLAGRIRQRLDQARS